MTLDTTVYIARPTHIRELRLFCAAQLDIPEGVDWHEGQSAIAPELTLLTPEDLNASVTGKGHLALLLYFLDFQGHARRVEVSWTTGVGYRGPDGQTAAGLHDQLTNELGAWLDERGLLWHRYTLT